ncbi:hypothetical protein SARC_04127 [Sphaeroforma arctica JP610]|uniref:Uncharacterized protein n=1 Tax=Sphaeroforma arctica JP610 TaxID=667725 RepID=A0A0L0G5Y8_9EUKA|nr:hypothetical protein SARC_04127 [Sphaeroforma arctica JP610]KNC83628.1 hypothetical protein SARC_04127 [Sphaeroforma arctica JP610]|eukprot:XP_014157530.1 hypothetical protein SARC_04127 [Sphaeroforma arctica JP610]
MSCPRVLLHRTIRHKLLSPRFSVPANASRLMYSCTHSAMHKRTLSTHRNLHEKSTVAHGEWMKPVPVSYNKRDSILYSLGIGSDDLEYVFEHHPAFSIFPTYPLVLGFKGDSSDVVGFPSKAMEVWDDVFKGFPPLPPGSLLDAERRYELLKPLPVDGGDFLLYSRLKCLLDKRKFGSIEMEFKLMDKESKHEYARFVSGTAAVGLKGFEPFGETSFESVVRPDRPADSIVKDRVADNQAHIYRLSGDYNTLHIDPEVAKNVGFDQPILHGLCTLGFAVRAVLKTYCDNDSSKFKTVRVRWSAPVFPGDVLETRMWVMDSSESDASNSATRVQFEVVAADRDNSRVISSAYVDYHSS